MITKAFLLVRNHWWDFNSGCISSHILSVDIWIIFLP